MSRLRVNATLYPPAPPRTGKRGRPRKWGQQLASLSQIATSPATKWDQQAVCRYRKTATLELAEIDCLWEPLGAETPVRVILVKDAARPCGYQMPTAPATTVAQTVERYADRWPIEV